MKAVILAGGFGTRISEESMFKPKPLIDIGGMPILWHIMKYYYCYGIDDFVILGGYKQDQIKQFFNNYYVNFSDVSFDMKNNKMSVLESHAEPWNVTVLDTGLNTMTGGRIKRARKYLENERFLLTYGDGVSDVNISELIKYHTSKGKLATITAVMPGGRFGALDINSEGLLNKFKEKKREDGGWINGGFMVLEPEVIDYISGDGDMLENEPFEKMVLDRQLAAFKHYGFWQCMDSMKDRNYLEELIAKGKAPWIKW